MKKILIITPTLRSGGGVIRGLQNMLALLPKGKYCIDVLPLGFSDRDNVMLENCNVLEESFCLTATDGVYEDCENYKLKRLLWICKVLLALLHKINLRTSVVNWIHGFIARSYKGYDVVIAYQEGAATRFAQHINCPRRIAWIHCDYAKYYELRQCRSEEIIYLKFNEIVCVSKYTLDNFVNIYPSLKKRSSFIYNLLDIYSIRDSSMKPFEDITFDNEIVNLVSIGRINPVKQFHLIPQIIYKIINNGIIGFRWILIGGEDSNALSLIKQEVDKYNISECYFKYIGAKFNPFPYIKNSDILVSTSSSEACPFVVNEARVLGVPVVANNYPSIFEFITDGINGCICTIDEMSRVLSELIKNRQKLNSLKERVKADEYNNDDIIRKICNLIDLN